MFNNFSDPKYKMAAMLHSNISLACIKYMYIIQLWPFEKGIDVVVIVCWLDLQLPIQSVPITTNVVSLNPQARCTRYIYVIKFGSRWFSPVSCTQ